MSRSPALIRRLVATTAALAVLGAAPLIASELGASASVTSAKIGLSVKGSSQSSIAASLAMFPNAKVARLFSSDLQPFSQSNIRYFPATVEVWVSWNTSPAVVASGAYDATFATILQSWNASGRTIKWSWTHEADNPANHYNPAQIRAGWAHLLAVEARYPSARVKSMSIYEAYLLDPKRPHGDPASWYVPADVLGFDTYVSVNEARAIAYAKSKGKPWSVPETGAKGDAASLAFIKSMISGWASYAPIGVCWFSSTSGGYSQSLSSLPKTLAYLKSIA